MSGGAFDFAEFRPTPPDAAEQVAALPRRTAHALYALLAWVNDNPNSPALAREVMLYDPEAISPRATGVALRNALRLGLCDRATYWFPTNRGYDLQTALEDRFLSDTATTQDRGDAR